MLAMRLSVLVKLRCLVELTTGQIDGVIDIERTKSWKFEHEDAKISADAVTLSFNCSGISG